MGDMQTEVVEVLDAAGTELVPRMMRDVIIADLAPIAGRLPVYAEIARTVVVENELDAQAAADTCEKIADDIKAVRGHDVLTGIITGFHTVHRRLTALRDAFVSPMESARKTIKGKVIAWTEGERVKAEAEQRRLQAIADEQARRERERLEKEAAKLKTEEKREARLEQAAQVVAPVIQVQAPRSAVKVARVWVARVIDAKTFFAAIATRPELAGYCEINVTKLARAKSSNPLTEIAGVEFSQEIR